MQSWTNKGKTNFEELGFVFLFLSKEIGKIVLRTAFTSWSFKSENLRKTVGISCPIWRKTVKEVDKIPTYEEQRGRVAEDYLE